MVWIAHHRRIVCRNVEGDIPMGMKGDEVVQHRPKAGELSPRSRHRPTKNDRT